MKDEESARAAFSSFRLHPSSLFLYAYAVGVEGGAEFVDGLEVLERVVVGLLHVAGVDEGEDDAAEVEGGGDVPAPQDGAGEQAPLLQGEAAEALAELLAGDVAAHPGGLGFGGVGFFKLAVDLLDGEAQPLLDKL